MVDHQAVACAFVGPAVARADEHGVSRPDHHVRETNRLILPSSVRSSPTKTVRVRPTPRPNLPDSSDESEGGLIEAFRERNARDEAMGAADVVETVVGLDKGLAVGESVVGLDESLVVGETVVGLGLGDSDEEVTQGGPSNKPSNEPSKEPINLDEQFFIDQHNDLCEVCNKPGFLLCCEKCNLVFHMSCVGLRRRSSCREKQSTYLIKLTLKRVNK